MENEKEQEEIPKNENWKVLSYKYNPFLNKNNKILNII